MQAFITSYGFDFSLFQASIVQTKALIAGSSALALYLKENDVNPDFEPNGIDIFVTKENSIALLEFIHSNGYDPIFQEKSIPYSTLNQIDLVVTFVKNDKIIQVIVLVNIANVLDYIICHFDLSVCATWWNAEENTLKTLCSDTLSKDMHLINTTLQYQQLDGSLNLTYRERINKYTARGFDMFSPPLPSEAFGVTDDLSGLQSPTCTLLDTVTFDVAAFEDISTAQFLKQSVNNIIVYIGNQFHGYNRAHLCNYISGRQSWLSSVGNVYSTPSNHLISEHALTLMKYSDFTVFAYSDPYTVNEKQLYSMYMFTVQQWTLGTPGLYVSAEEDAQNMIGYDIPADELPPSSPILQRMDGYESMPDLLDEEINIIIN